MQLCWRSRVLSYEVKTCLWIQASILLRPYTLVKCFVLAWYKIYSYSSSWVMGQTSLQQLLTNKKRVTIKNMPNYHWESGRSDCSKSRFVYRLPSPWTFFFSGSETIIFSLWDSSVLTQHISSLLTLFRVNSISSVQFPRSGCKTPWCSFSCWASACLNEQENKSHEMMRGCFQAFWKPKRTRPLGVNAGTERGELYAFRAYANV